MDRVHGPGPWRGSMDLVHEGGPWTRSKEGVHGPGVHVLSSPRHLGQALHNKTPSGLPKRPGSILTHSKAVCHIAKNCRYCAAEKAVKLLHQC